MKRFFSIVNTSIPFGRGLNALAHTSLGIGHWFPKDKMPSIMVLFGDEEIIREFRKKSHQLTVTHPEETLYSDFTNTMTVGTTDNCVKITRETPENQLTYYAASLCAEEELFECYSFDQIIGRCQRLKHYEPYVVDKGESEFTFKKRSGLPDYQSLPTLKISLTLDRTRLPSELINATVISSLGVGMQAALTQLKLLMYIDGDDQKHSYISYHPFPILAARQQNKLNELAKKIEEDNQFPTKIVRDKNGNTVSVCLLGDESKVNAYTKHKSISLWTAELPEDTFIII